MALTDISIRALVHGDKPIKKTDEKGLFLLLQPSGGKLWRFKYRFNGKEKKLGLGRYPDASLMALALDQTSAAALAQPAYSMAGPSLAACLARAP